jgi:hypothetical protein
VGLRDLWRRDPTHHDVESTPVESGSIAGLVTHTPLSAPANFVEKIIVDAHTDDELALSWYY